MTVSTRAKRLNLYIDANSLAADHFSGVGHYALGVIRAIDDFVDNNSDINVSLVVVEEKKSRLKKYDFKNLGIVGIPIQKDEFQGSLVEGRLPAIDKMVGNGIYFFPDFVTWPLAESRAITTIHDLSFEEVPQFVDDGNAKFLRRAVRDSAKRADYLATVTDSMKKTISDFYHLNPNNLIVTTNAADTDKFFKRPTKEIQLVKEKYGITGEYILCVGNIEPRKNQMALLEAFALLPAELTQKYSVVLVGAGGWKNGAIYDTVKKFSQKGITVQVIEGKVTDEDLPAVYSGAAASANPSFYEGFGMPTIEAMACEVPVIVSDIPVMREVAGSSAVYVDPNDVMSIKSGLESVLLMPSAERSKTLRSNRKKATSYNWSSAALAVINAATTLNQAAPKRTKSSLVKRVLGTLWR